MQPKKQMSKPPKKPLLRVNMAQSMDGHTIQPDGRWRLGSAEDKRRMDRLRLWADCIIASRRSIENDNPSLFARSKPHAKQPLPVIIMADKNRKISATSGIFKHPHPPGMIWVKDQQELSLEDVIDLSAANSGLNLERIKKWQLFTFQKITDLYNHLMAHKFKKILLEGGPSLNGHFIEEDLIDEIFFTLVPYVWGGQTNDRLITSPDFLSLKKFRILNVERRKDEVFFRYKKVKPSNR